MSGPTQGVCMVCVSPEELCGPPAAGVVLVRAPSGAAGAGAGLAQLVHRRGIDALPHGALPLHLVHLPPSPTLDDLLAGMLCMGPAGPHSGLDLLCDYAAQVREGILPGSVAQERSLGGMYLVMMELYRRQPEVLLERGLLLLEGALRGMARGGSLLHDDLFQGDDRFTREEAYLEADRARYVRDRQAGSCMGVRVGHLPAYLLHLLQPTSILFRLFASRDKEAPGGSGFDLLLVQRPGVEGRVHVALFADPTRRLPLREVLVPLCQKLTLLEVRHGAPGGQWYEGAQHGYQRLASPRQGSAVPIEQVVRVLRRALHTERGGARTGSAQVGRRWHEQRSSWIWLLCALLLGVGPGPRKQQEPVVRGDWQAHRLPDGPPMPPAEMAALRQGQGQGKIRRYAVLVAASEYTPRAQGGLGPLRTPWRDACTLRQVLVRRFGYRPGDITVLSDSPCLRGAGPPTRERLLWTIEQLPIRQDDTLLFYYAGHGAIEDEPGGRYGYLQPGGWEQRGLSREDRGLRMRVLAELLRDKVAARHQLLLIDACHSGETAVLRGEDALGGLEAPARADWRERPVYAVVTATRTEDLALEERLIDAPHPHSLFVRALLDGLSYAPRASAGGAPVCRLRADEDPKGAPDGIVTDGELFKYVARRLPELRAGIEVPGLPDEAQQQVPEWNPWAAAPRGRASRIGEFLLMPGAPPPARCDGVPEPEPDGCAVCESP